MRDTYSNDVETAARLARLEGEAEYQDDRPTAAELAADERDYAEAQRIARSCDVPVDSSDFLPAGPVDDEDIPF